MPRIVAVHLGVVQPHLPFGLLKAVLNRPASARDPHHLGHRRVRGSVDSVIGELGGIAPAAAGEQPVGHSGPRRVGQGPTRPVKPAPALTTPPPPPPRPGTRPPSPPP